MMSLSDTMSVLIMGQLKLSNLVPFYKTQNKECILQICQRKMVKLGKRELAAILTIYSFRFASCNNKSKRQYPNFHRDLDDGENPRAKSGLIPKSGI